jgi:uroporphyrinogen-III synthase
LVSFSPTELNHYLKLPDFKQNDTKCLKYHKKEALDNGLRVDILAPSPNTPSMTMALEKYIEANKGK